MRLVKACVGCFLIVAFGCANSHAGSASAAAARIPTPYTDYPDSIAVLAHSQATGENTEPPQGTDTTANSWATGTNPAVGSVYLRILAENPGIKNHNYNYAQLGATIQMINQQAIDAAKKHPDLVLIQSIDNDLVCPATTADYTAFGDGVDTVLDTLARLSPSSRVFMVTQFGSPDTYLNSLTAAQRIEFGSTLGGPGPCAFADERGRLVPKEFKRLESIILAYEGQIARVCDTHPNCDHDHGAFSQTVDAPGDYTDDLNHLSIQGHAHAAQVAWTALQDAGLIPAQ